MQFSIVTTAFNEELVICEFIDRCIKVIESISPNSYEIVIVDNGSTDRTSELVKSYINNGLNIKLVILSRNFGYQGGIDAALNNSQGNWVFVLDADLQDPPELLIDMVNKTEANKNLDLVLGVRTSRQETFFRKTCYWIFYRLWSLIADIPVVLDSGDCCLLSNRAVNLITSMPERARFLRGQRLWIGLVYDKVYYHRIDREKGTTKFNLLSAASLALDGIFAYSFFPIRLITFIGFFILTLLLLVISFFTFIKVYSYLWNYNFFISALPSGLTFLQLMMGLFFGLLFLMLGVVGEYVARIYDEVRARPRFIIKELIKKY